MVIIFGLALNNLRNQVINYLNLIIISRNTKFYIVKEGLDWLNGHKVGKSIKTSLDERDTSDGNKCLKVEQIDIKSHPIRFTLTLDGCHRMATVVCEQVTPMAWNLIIAVLGLLAGTVALFVSVIGTVWFGCYQCPTSTRTLEPTSKDVESKLATDTSPV